MNIEEILNKLNCIENPIITNKELKDVKEGTEFDAVEHGGKEFCISKKYIAKRQLPQGTSPSSSKTRYKVPKRLDRVRDDQF